MEKLRHIEGGDRPERIDEGSASSLAFTVGLVSATLIMFGAFALTSLM
jgi:hypothetical protein